MKKILFTILALAQLSSVIAQIPSYVPSSGLVAWWPFTGNAKDSSGNGNDGTVYGATLTTDRFGKTNSAYNFNVANWTWGANGDYIYIPYKPVLNFQEFTVSAWVRRASNGATMSPQALALICRFEYGYTSPYGESWFLNIAHGTSSTGAVLTGVVIQQAPSPAPNFFCTTTKTIPQNQWSFVTMTYSNKTINMYIDGQLACTTKNVNITINSQSTSGISIGLSRQANGHWSPFDGKLDDIGIWNRALDPCEIAGLYQSKVVSPKPSSVSIGANTQNYCGKDSVKITATSGFKSYAWSNGKTGSSIFVKNTGTYTVAATDSQGCTVYDTAVISVLNPKISPRDTVACNVNSVNLSVKNVSLSGNCGSMDAGLKIGMTAWYPFCGNANDQVGTNNGTITGGASLTTGELSVPNTAYSFNGSSSYIGLSQPFLGGGQVSEFTLRSKVKLNSLSNNPNFWIKTLFWGEISWGISNGAVQLFWANNVTGNKYSNIFTDTSVVKLKTAKWYDLIVTFKNSKGTIYVDGLPVATKMIWSAQGGAVLSTTQVESSANFQQDAGSSRLGVRNIGGSWVNYLNGSIDEFNVWNRALSASEISKLYTQESTGSGKFNWSTSDTTATTKITQTGKSTVWVKVSNGIGSCYDTTSVRIQKPIVSIGKDTQSFCGVDSAKLTATSGFASYNWSNGKKGASVYANATGPISVTATDSFGCSANDNALISVQNPRILPRDTIVCSGQAVTLRVKDTTVGVSGCAALPAMLKTGLVGWWPFCGNANDESGNGNHGKVYGAKLQLDRFGKSNSAYELDGKSKINLGRLKEIDTLNSKKNISYSVWFKADKNQSVFSRMPLLSKRQAPWSVAGYSQSYLTLHGGGQAYYSRSNKYIAYAYVDEHFYSGGINNGLDGGQTDDEKWHHVVVSKSNSKYKLYFDGALLDSISDNKVLFSIDSMVVGFQGVFGFDSERWFKGLIDDIGIWNRPLTNTEVNSLYNLNTKILVNTWSTGDTTSRTRIQTAGTTQVWLKQFNGIGTCYDTTTVRISNPVLNVAADTLRFTNCKRDSLRLSVGKKWKTVQWSHGPKDSAVFLKNTGKYSVRVQDSVGCFAADTFNFINPGKVVAQLLSTDSVRCFAESNGKAVVKGTGGFAPLTYLWNDGLSQKTTTAAGLKAGTYKAIITDAFGCKDSATAVIREPNKLAIQITALDSPTCFGYSDGRITSIGTGGNPSYLWKWSGGQTTSAITGLAKGTYKVLLTDRKGCRDSSIVVLGEPAQVIPKIIAGQISMRDEFLSYTTSVTPTGTYVYSWQPAAAFGDQANKPDGKIKLSKNTTLRLLVTSPNGCIGRDSLNVTVIQPIANILPNAFSPNSDGLNEGFGLPDIFEIKDFVVYDRWGGIIFKGNSVSSKWNGKVGNSDATAGTYAYSITAVLKGTNQQVSYTGRVTLIK
jgi:gliding motility-associated-like protein